MLQCNTVLIIYMKKNIPSLEIRVIDGCDHWMIDENPEAVDRVLAEFLDIIDSFRQC